MKYREVSRQVRRDKEFLCDNQSLTLPSSCPSIESYNSVYPPACVGLTSEDNAGTVWRELFTLPAPHWPGSPGQIVPRLPCGQPGHQLGADGGEEGEAGHGAGVQGQKVRQGILRPALSDQVHHHYLLLAEN